jgi:two-component system, OmpR family, sensor histidine kinase KdpD
MKPAGLEARTMPAMADAGDRTGARRYPDDILRDIEAAERAERRGQLKIFLGYTSGVGKSFRLFDEGRRRHERGEDVVVAAMPAEPAAEVAQALRELEIVPTRDVGGVAVVDVDALLLRRPQVCLVDGLAYDNPPGSRRARRYQDVDDLLAAGISVLTSTNLEYIAEQQPFVRQVAGGTPRESVPQDFISRADEVVVVDVPADIGAPDVERLSALRQRALLLTAQVVDRQLEDYLRRQGVRSSWGTQERILVCMTPRANAAKMLAAARRNVDQFHGELFAIYVVQAGLTEEDRMANERNAALALAQDARLDVLEGRDPAATILDYAKRHNITQMFVGHTLKRTWTARFAGSPLDRLVREADGIDVRVFPQ